MNRSEPGSLGEHPVDPSELPDWADPRLTIRLHGHGDQVFVIDGNPHTSRGLLRVYSVAEHVSLSIRPDEVAEATEFAAGWLSGYVDGSEPDRHPVEAVDDLRRSRVVEFYDRSGYELAPNRQAAFAINAVRSGERRRARIDEVYAELASMLSELADLAPFWRQVRWRPFDTLAPELDPIQVADAEDITRLFVLMNPGYALRDDISSSRVLRMVNMAGDGVDEGIVELVIEIANDGDHLDRASLTLNIERLDAAIGGATGPGQATETVARALLDAVVRGFSPDAASVSGGEALRHCELAAPFAEDPALHVIPGWLTFIGTYVVADPTQLAALPVTARTVPDGIMIEADQSLSNFGVADANALCRALDIP